MAQVSYLEEEGIKISRGMVKNVIPVHRSGYNPSLQNGEEEMIWNYSSGSQYLATAANTVTAVSSSTLDTGVDVTIEGLDSSWNPMSETIRINGTTPVRTTNTFIRILSTINTGSNTIIGNITLTQDGSNVVAYIQDGIGRSLSGDYAIPAGYTGYLYKGNASVGKGGDAEVRMYVRYFGKTWIVAHIVQLYENAYIYDFNFPSVLPEKTDMKVTALTTSTGSAIACNFDILLVKNSQ